MAQGKAKLGREGTMKATAKDAVSYLSKGQKGLYPYVRDNTKVLFESQGLLENENDDDTQSASKPSLARDSTMAATAKEAKGLLGANKLGDTRQETAKQKAKGAKKSPMKRGNTIARTLADAKFLLDGKEVNINEGRKTRSGGKLPPPKVKAAPKAKKPAVKRAGTMQKTAKEGKSYIKRGKF